MTRPLRVVFLVETAETAGMGHLRRVVPLAEVLRERGATCSFSLTDPARASLVASAGFPVGPWDRTDTEAVAGHDVVVIDGYTHPQGLLEGWAGRAVRVLVDDLATRPQEAEIVINHNLYADDCDYTDYRADRVLRGPRHTIVARAFRALRDRPTPDAPRILVSFGGTDRGEFALPATRALRRVAPDTPVSVALMEAAPGVRDELAAAGADVHVGRPLEEAMAGCSVLVGAAGLTVSEASAAGLDVVACSIADNQTLYVAAGRRLGLIIRDGFDPEWLAAAVARLLEGDRVRSGSPLVDGWGAERIADEIVAAVRSRRTIEQTGVDVS